MVGLDYYGNLVAGASNQVTVTYTGSAVSPVGRVVINEIMYNPAAPDASYVEIHNASSTTYFDLSGWRLNGADFNFPGGSVLAPGGFVLAVKDYDKFLAAYGPNRPVAGEFDGSLDNGGETLQLIKPGATPEQDLVVCEVRYDDDAPWPIEADGTGPSLQLRDATEDIRRVANWGVGGETTGSEPGWQFVAVTGTASSSRLYIYLNSAGDFYLDDLQLVAGSVAGAGANMIQNGDFESALSGPWTVSANLSGSVISTAIKHTGNGSLHVVSSSGGTTQGSSIWQNTLPLTADATYTLSYWYRPSTNGNQLTIRLSGNGINSTHSIAPPLVPASGPFTPGTVNSIATNLAALPPLWLNEVMPNNTTNLADRFGHFEPWAELYNAGATAIHLSGYYLTDDFATPLKWAFPAGAWIQPNGFQVIFVDGVPGESITNELHTSFRLNSATGAVALVRLDNGQPQIVDYLNYRLVSEGRSYGSLPDGQPVHRQLFSIPTPGGTNNGAYPPVLILINEWMAGNATLPDPADGDFDDWFELYNAGTTAVDLGGYRLTDNLAEPGQFIIPSGVGIGPGGFLLVWADDETGQNGGDDLHTNFKLSVGGEAIGLYDPNLNLVDAVTFPAQTNDVSQGRSPDGFPAPFEWLPTPTPGGPNSSTSGNTPPALAAVGNKAVDEGALLDFDLTATDSDVPAQTLTFTLDPGVPAGANVSGGGSFTWTPTEGQGPGVYTVTARVTDNGMPPLSDTRTFQIVVAEVNESPLLTAITNRTINEGVLHTFPASATDVDVPANELTFSLDPGAPAGAAIHPTTGAFTWVPSENQGPGLFDLTVRVTDDGVPALSDFKTFTITVNEANNPPSLAVPPTQTMVESQTLTVTNTATDSDLPAQPLTFGLVSAPSGVNLNTSSGVLTWTPTEAQGPSTNTITVRVLDNGAPSLSSTQSFIVIVLETNSAPGLTVPATQTLFELATLTVTNTATDNDLPAQTLTFGLVSAPGGVNLNASSGVLTWTPSEAQGPNTNTIALRAFDNGSPSLSVTQSFTVIVLETNRAPTLEPIGDQTVTIGAPLSFTATASDGDLPAQTLSFSLGPGAPSGASIGANSGQFTWTPDATQAGPHSITVRVRDNGNPALEDSETVTITVNVPTLAVSLLSITNEWRYDQSGNDLGTAWRGTGFDDSAWAQGAALLCNETAALPAPKNTPLSLTNGAGARVITYYFRAEFWLPADPSGVVLTASNLIDDGAVFYLNGTEVGRYNMPNGTVTASTLASNVVDNATTFEALNLPSNSLVTGRNVLAVEVHQINTNSSDVVFGLSLDAELPAQEPLSITNQPQSLAVTAGDTAQFSVGASGDFPHYQWLKDGDLIPGANGPVLVLNQVQPSDAGVYRAVVTNLVSAATSEAALLTVNPPPNTPPTLLPLGDRSVIELTTLSVTNVAFDDDLPPQSLTFALVLAPTGVDLNPGSGVLTWTPTEAQGPSTNTITVRVFDNGIPSLSATQSFSVVALETNRAPTLSPIQDQFVSEGALLSLTVSASDPDLPTQSLTFSLEPGAPSGAMVGATNGVLTWTPPIGHHPATNQITVRVTDDGVPSLSDTRTFQAVVVSAPVVRIETPSNGTATLRWPTVVGRRYQVQFKNDLEDGWSDLGTAITAAETITTVTDDMNGRFHRFYRIVLLE
jgi:hypothetical protein